MKTALELSGNAEALNDLSSKMESFQPRNVLLPAADDDHGRDAYAQTLFEKAEEPKEMEILEGSSAHGTDWLKESRELRKKVMIWLSSALR